MHFTLDRRSFLQSLIALGASYALPANATPGQVEQAWTQAQVRPWYFDVTEWGTISDPDCAQEETWGEVFDIGTHHLETAGDVIDEVLACQPLINHFQELARDEIDALVEELEGDLPPKLPRRRQLARLVEVLRSDPDDGWLEWVEVEGRAGVARFRDEIEAWLQEPADYLQSEWFPLRHGAQGQAKAFFEGLAREVLVALRVVIIEGEHPGSTYYAAELRQSIDDANATAAELGLPFRFRRA